jgi:hypothetical protein
VSLSRTAIVALALMVGLLGLDFLRLPEASLGVFTLPGPLTGRLGSAPPAPAFVASMALTLAGALVGCWLGRANAARALFVGTLLGALVLQSSYHFASASGSTLGVH